MKKADCRWYLSEFCCKDLDSGRAWDCTAPNREMRIEIEKKLSGKDWTFSCSYPKLGKD